MAFPSAFRVSPYPGTQWGRKGPRLGHLVSMGVTSAGASSELPHGSGAPCLAHKTSSKGPSQGLSLAQSRELPPGWVTLPGLARGYRAGWPQCPCPTEQGQWDGAEQGRCSGRGVTSPLDPVPHAMDPSLCWPAPANVS